MIEDGHALHNLGKGMKFALAMERKIVQDFNVTTKTYSRIVCGSEILRYKPEDLPLDSAPPASSFSTHHQLQRSQQFYAFHTKTAHQL
jgi:hypothetical protein